MNRIHIALANVRLPANLDESVRIAVRAIEEAAIGGADIICFPECFVPGYRAIGRPVAPANAELLERAWSEIADAAAKGCVAVVLGTERLAGDALIATALVINADGTRAGFRTRCRSTLLKKARTHRAPIAASFTWVR
ncbi:MAG TPA: nitrilase-related carbon-nitrogen hydrolase [Thermoanaerobaculia bacterium]|nr:nitrilase-related carbon-nitrogen hydrolase [Thermoanaerobaculia bacterium]